LAPHILQLHPMPCVAPPTFELGFMRLPRPAVAKALASGSQGMWLRTTLRKNSQRR
jgi:hypothetical protein